MRRVKKERLERIYTAAGWRVLKICINIFINTSHIKMYRTSPEKRKGKRNDIIFAKDIYIYIYIF